MFNFPVLRKRFPIRNRGISAGVLPKQTSGELYYTQQNIEEKYNSVGNWGFSPPHQLQFELADFHCSLDPQRILSQLRLVGETELMGPACYCGEMVWMLIHSVFWMNKHFNSGAQKDRAGTGGAQTWWKTPFCAEQATLTVLAEWEPPRQVMEVNVFPYSRSAGDVSPGCSQDLTVSSSE